MELYSPKRSCLKHAKKSMNFVWQTWPMKSSINKPRLNKSKKMMKRSSKWLLNLWSSQMLAKELQIRASKKFANQTKEAMIQVRLVVALASSHHCLKEIGMPRRLLWRTNSQRMKWESWIISSSRLKRRIRQKTIWSIRLSPKTISSKLRTMGSKLRTMG